MREPSPERFARTVADLAQPALVAFVADLWAARGFETRADALDSGCRLVCTRDDEVTTVLVPERESVLSRVRRGVRTRVGGGDDRLLETTERDVDVVVSPTADSRAKWLASASGARLHDARSLYDFALYGVDRHEADAVFRRHLDAGINTRPAPAVGDASHSRSRWEWLPSEATTRSLTTAVTGIVILALVVAGVGVGFGSDRAGPTDVTPSAAGEASESTSTPGPGSDSRVFGTGPPPADDDSDTATEVLLAPGLASRGLVDPDRLARAHADGVDGRSYVWRVSYTEERGETVASATAAHRVQSAAVLRVDLETTGVLATDPGRLAPRPAYADGETRYVLSRGEVVRRPLESTDHYAGHAQRVLSGLLRANETDITDGWVVGETVLYRVSLEGTRDPSRTGYRAVAFVSPEGVIHLFEARWVDPEANVTVSVRWAYDFVDDPNVTRPGWVESTSPAPNATSANASTPTATPMTTTPTPTATHARYATDETVITAPGQRGSDGVRQVRS